MSLLEAEKGQCVIIKKLQHNIGSKSLLMGLGLLPGDKITVVATSTFGSPITILRGENTLAMRTAQARLVQVEIV